MKLIVRTPLQLANSIRVRRRKLGLSQVQLAAKIGVRQKTLSDIENARSARLDTLLKILAELDLELVVRPRTKSSADDIEAIFLMARGRIESINVFLNSRLVGQLRRETSGAISFQYDHSWLEWESVMPVSLSLPVREQIYRGAPVIAVFDNLLPDNSELRRQNCRAHADKKGRMHIAFSPQSGTIMWVRSSSWPPKKKPSRY